MKATNEMYAAARRCYEWHCHPEDGAPSDDVMDDVVDAALSAAWQPIETAPRDRHVLVTDGSSVEKAKWGYLWLATQTVDGKTEYIHGFHASHSVSPILATHWVPLPKPPEGRS
jgi:hypothetical protein